MDRELINHLIHSSGFLESTHPELRTEMERELALFDRLMPELQASLNVPEPAVTATAQHPALSEAFHAKPMTSASINPSVENQPKIAGTQNWPSRSARPTLATRSTVSFKRSFFNSSRIIKGSQEN